MLDALQPADLLRTMIIRGETHTVLATLQRQVVYYDSHVGQLVQLAKIIQGNEFKSLGIPRGQSQKFNQQMGRVGPK